MFKGNKEKFYLKYSRRIWLFDLDFKKETYLEYWSCGEFRRRFGKTMRFRLEIAEGIYRIVQTEFKGNDEIKRLIGMGETEEEVQNTLVDYIGNMQEKYKIKEMLR